MINARIAQIDKLISDQLNEVMHHEDFRSWKAPGVGCTIW
jgi:predicted component of type VI protein secretion system